MTLELEVKRRSCYFTLGRLDIYIGNPAPMGRAPHLGMYRSPRTLELVLGKIGVCVSRLPRER